MVGEYGIQIALICLLLMFIADRLCSIAHSLEKLSAEKKEEQSADAKREKP